MSDVFENKYIKSIKDIEEKMSLGEITSPQAWHKITSLSIKWQGKIDELNSKKKSLQKELDKLAEAVEYTNGYKLTRV